MAADLSCRSGWVSREAVQRIARLLERAGLPVVPPAELDVERYLQLMMVDKKVKDGRIRLVLLKEIGRAFVSDEYETDLLNQMPHPSTIICPITTNVKNDSEILRVHIKRGEANLLQNCDIMLDQLRAIDNKRLVKKVGDLPQNLIEKVKENLMIIIDLE